ncbi:ANTAR domain-containing protein [Rubritalea squalenifaciens DSM 18772]|uniref:ANTAR domain-containing protein n=1 Tax=Rubritalea squalenifaciens DSM 18772 TaxID=1123071 RepID=A0A1M6DVD9_9BACT|nr:ANTAR domain-containing protein [Rubritalea squalenifaciens]SHI77216.1 ANTAR domain-containing protein [Rubritalea squalenifaciens DSM 18772]
MNTILTLLMLCLGATLGLGEEKAFEVLRKYATEHQVSKENIASGLKGAKWNSDKSAVAFPRPESSLCLVAYKTEEG